MTVKRNFGMSDEDFKLWLDKFPDDPEGCIACGAIAGCCTEYPKCPGNPDWKLNGESICE